MITPNSADTPAKAMKPTPLATDRLCPNAHSSQMHHLSVASGVGFIALAGVSAEFGVIMLLYLKHAWDSRLARGTDSEADLLDAIREGAVLRVRPKAMTVAVMIAGLVPVMLGTGTGSEIMQR